MCHTVGSRITVAPDLSYNSGSCAARTAGGPHREGLDRFARVREAGAAPGCCASSAE